MARGRSWLVAAMTRKSTWMVARPPTRSKLRSSSARKSLVCSAGDMSPISSRKMVPPSACSSRPILVLCAPVKAPRSWPNSSDSRSSVDSAAQLTATNARSRLLPSVWMARATSSLPVPDSPVTSTVASASAARSTTRNRRRIGSDWPTISPSRPFSGAPGAQLARQPARPHLRQGRLDRGADLLVGERLDEVLVRAEAHGLDRRLHRRVRGHHDHLHVAALRAHAPEHLDAVDAGHRQVAQDDVGAVAELGQRLLARARGVDLAPPLVGDEDGERAAHVGLVVDDEHARADRRVRCGVGHHSRDSGMPQLKWMRPGKWLYHGAVFQRSSVSVCTSG